MTVGQPPRGEAVEPGEGRPSPPVASQKAAPLERERRLSESILWQLQRNFYRQRSLDAWRTSDPVPFYVTTSPALVDTCVKLAEGFLRDCSARQRPTEPVYFIELGAGHGRFGYRFLKRFSKARAAGLDWVYVMTDLAERNLEFLQSNPALRPYVESGRLDFACFDIGHDSQLTLANSGRVIGPGTSGSPLVIFANYVFDTLPQDAFYVQGGDLYECRLTVSTGQPEPDLNDPTILTRAQVTFTRHNTSSEHYPDPEWNAILELYRQRLPETSFSLPVVALEGLRTLEGLSDGRLLLVAADKAVTRPDQFATRLDPAGMAIHAGHSFSMTVNFDAIARHFRQRGGHAFHPPRDPQSLTVSAFVVGSTPGDDFPETASAYVESVAAFGPDDFYTAMGALNGRWESLQPDEIFAFLHLARGDDWVLGNCLPILTAHVPTLSEAQRRHLLSLVRDAWDAYLPMGEVQDRPFELGLLLYEMGCYADALQLFNTSVEVYGQQPGTLYNVAACHYRLNNSDKAFAAVNASLELDPNFDAARALRLMIEDARG